MDFTMQLRRKYPQKLCLHSPRKKQQIAPKKRKSLPCRSANKCVCLPQPSSQFEFPRIWKDLLHKGQLCDGSVTCADGTEIRIHRAILSAASPYFRAVFTNTIGGKEEHNANVAAPSTVFQQLLDWVYTGNCRINARNVETLLAFADQYEILGVVQLCCRFLLDQLCTTNCLGILKFASQYFCSDLAKKGQNFIRAHFTNVVKESTEFVNITANELADIIHADELNVKNEDFVFDAIIKWLLHDFENRKCHFLELLKHVRFGILHKECVLALRYNQIVESVNECKEYMQAVCKEYDTPSTSPDPILSESLFRPRVPYEILFAIGGWSAGTPTNFMETYDIRADRWLLSSDTDSTPRAYHGICALAGLIYVIGGFDGNSYFNTVRRFDPVAHKWSECACMYSHRCYVSVVAYDNRVYALGGFNGRGRMNSAERYNPVKNQWEMLPAMQKQRSDASAAAHQDKIYIVGGFNGQQVMRSAEMFDLKTNQWSYIPQMMSARSGVSLIVHDNALFALGGFNGYVRLTSGEKFVPGQSTWWTEIADMMTARSNFATVIMDNAIYVIGGFNDNFIAGSSTINFVEYFDTETDEWFEAAEMNLNRSALGACVLSGLENAHEYSVLACNQGKERGEEDSVI